MILAVYLGIGFAIALAYGRNLLYGHGARTWDQVNSPLLASSIVLLCFAVVGVRVIFAMPLALRANWIFRITAVRRAPLYFASVRRSLLVIAVAPVWIVCTVFLLSIWPLWQAVGHLVALALLGSIVADLSLRGFHKIPFTCSYLPGKAGIHVTSGAFAIALLALTDLGVQIEMRALRDPAAYLKFVAVMGCVAVWLMRQTASQKSDADLKFEETPQAEIFALELHRDGTMPPVSLRDQSAG